MAKKVKKAKGEVKERVMVTDDRPLNRAGKRMSNAEWAGLKGKQEAERLKKATRHA